MEKLEEIIAEKAKSLSGINLNKEYLESLHFLYPFNRFQHAISHLLALGAMTLDEYREICRDYQERNKYLHLFEITAPRNFGTWAEQHITRLVGDFVTPSKSTDPNYKGEYDLCYKDIKLEVKASRAVDSSKNAPLMERALFSKSTKPFNMNFQQLKPECCDIFIWVGVWCDLIRYWVLSADDLIKNPYFSKGQHRGNKGEGQLWITNDNIDEFSVYLTPAHDILNVVRKKTGRH